MARVMVLRLLLGLRLVELLVVLGVRLRWP
jgi:hypothetical protein